MKVLTTVLMEFLTDARLGELIGLVCADTGLQVLQHGILLDGALGIRQED